MTVNLLADGPTPASCSVPNSPEEILQRKKTIESGTDDERPGICVCSIATL